LVAVAGYQLLFILMLFGFCLGLVFWFLPFVFIINVLRKEGRVPSLSPIPGWNLVQYPQF